VITKPGERGAHSPSWAGEPEKIIINNNNNSDALNKLQQLGRVETEGEMKDTEAHKCEENIFIHPFKV
jgi:hypothetical protein